MAQLQNSLRKSRKPRKARVICGTKSILCLIGGGIIILPNATKENGTQEVHSMEE